jgi:hypothetical protein
MRGALCVVAVLALACLLIRAARVGLAGDYVDPIGKITAQDEALYSSSAIHMAHEGDWLTPRFMGRYALYKPPMLVWLAAFSARIAGISTFALRFPVALLCALGAGLVFLWAAEMRSWQAGVCAAVLLASSHLWHVLGSLCMTDGVLVAFYIGAMYCLFSDPWLESRPWLWGFAISAAGAILTKGIAGVLPLGALALYWLAAPRAYKPSFGRVCLAAALALALAAPWFLYQLAVHPRWFWTEHFAIEIFGYGGGAPPQTSQENHALFYLMRMALLDPILVAAFVAAAPAFITAIRKRSPGATLLLSWIAIVIASISVWQYRNASYLLPMIPALAIVVTAFGPVANMRPAWWMLPIAAAVFFLKTVAPFAPWGISFPRGTIQPVAPILSDYCSQARGNELILVGMDDDLYASDLPLPRLRYAIEGSPAENARYGMPFHEMGIVLTASEFNDLPRLESGFRDKLRQWGLDSAAAIGTLILAKNPDDFAAIVHAHPATDFLFPARYRQTVPPGDHLAVDAPPAHFFLLSREGRTAAPQWPCIH